MFSDKVREALGLALTKNEVFALYIMPDDDMVHFIASREVCRYDGGYKGDGFFVNSFNNSYGRPLMIADELSLDDAIEYFKSSEIKPASAISPFESSTDKNIYIERTNRVIAGLREDGGKAVISRAICGDATSVDWIDVVHEYFSKYTSTFRYIYNTPMTGMWFGASPEILVKRDASSDVIQTMALAGTRKCAEDDWDDKNIEEHDFVTRYIVSTLKSQGIKPDVGTAENVRFGSIEHLCHRIFAKYDGPIITVANALSPTPALAGFPLSRALEYIKYAELHPRHCYGGYVGCRNRDGEYVYVNLRCCHFNKQRYCIYAGGGITGKSDASLEWMETEAKSEFLRDLLKR